MTISARVVADSVSSAGRRLTTLQLRYPKFIHGELMTHRVFSRNASSSRAVPVERLIKDVLEDPVYPSHWGKNQAGMQAEGECDELVRFAEAARLRPMDRRQAWDEARNRAVEVARSFAAAGYHKQIVNRLLEPFCHINVVVTATEWSNFFALRCHPAAQPEMHELASKMYRAMVDSTPRLTRYGEWHLPYVDVAQGGWLDPDDDRPVRVSVARCARVSYLTQEGREPTVEEDLRLYDRLVGSVPLHASPCEHQATPDEFATTDQAIESYGGDGPTKLMGWQKPELHGNLVGWIQYRKTLPGECQ